VAGDAEGANVIEVALSPALGYGEDVVGVPERAAAGDGFHAVERESGDAGFAAGTLECVENSDGIGVAEGAAALIAGEDLIAEVAGVGAKAMLVDAKVGTEGAAAFGEDFKLAPATEGSPVFAAGKDVRADASARKRARDHGLGQNTGRRGGREVTAKGILKK
jgi:hypothetical protein